MSDKTLVSVIIPSYNRSHTIRRCVESVLAQTYDNLEVIVIDDCSTDNTREVVNGINDNRLRYFKLEKNHRACFARNYGFEQARGDLIAFQDSDDTWSPNKIAKQVTFLKEYDYDFVFCGMNRVSADRYFYYPVGTINTASHFYEQELGTNCISTQTMLMKRKVMESIKFDEEFKRYQDWDFSIRVIQHFSVGYLPEALVYSEIQKDSITANEDAYESLMKLYLKYESEINKYPNVLATFHYKLGDCLRGNKPHIAAQEYQKSLKARFNIKVFVKALLSSLRFKY